MKIIQISDAHIVAGTDSLQGLAPRERLRRCVADINANHADADLCAVTGDLTDAGDMAAYAEFRRIIAELTVPVQLMIGNHDSRINFVRAFPETETDSNGFVQSSRQIGGCSLIFLDTNEPGTHSGAYCDLRQKWLQSQLDALPKERPVYLFLHHQPFPIGWPALDEIGLIHADELQGILRKYPNLKYILFGHIHRTVTGCWNGIPFSAIPGTNHQIRWGKGGESEIVYTKESPAYNVIYINGDVTMIYQKPFDLDIEPGA